MDWKALFELSSDAKVIVALLSLPLVLWGAWVKVKKGAFSLSQERTKRLYELMLLKDVCAVPSGALSMAVNGAMNVELNGDKIRFALQHDNPLWVLRAFKSTLGVVAMSPDGQTCMYVRSSQRFSLRREKWTYIGAMAFVYLVLVVAAFYANFVSKDPRAPWLGFIFLCNVVSLPILMRQALRLEMARQLVESADVEELRRPASTLMATSTVATGDGLPSDSTTTTELPVAEEEHDEKDDPIGEVEEGIRKVEKAMTDGTGQPSEGTADPAD